jgi:hypothetical protein
VRAMLALWGNGLARQSAATNKSPRVAPGGRYYNDTFTDPATFP